jgi:hypothetical protein
MNFLRKMRRALRAVLLLVAMFLLVMTASAQRPTDLYGVPILDQQVFTNNATGVAGFTLTNTLTQVTNGSLTVTSAPVALRGGGFALEANFSCTNALLTNAVIEFRYSNDGTNWFAEPTLVWRSAAVGAVGKYSMGTNVAESVAHNYKYIQLWKVHATNGVNNVGNAFFGGTNGYGVRITQRNY